MNRNSSKFRLYEILQQTIQEERPVALATVIASANEAQIKPGSKMLVFPEGRVEGGLGDAKLNDMVRKDALDLLSQEKSKTVTCDVTSTQKIEVYIESILPPPPLVIVGADPDAAPIVSLGKQLGFKVILVDHRPDFANMERYPGADETVVATPVEMSQKLRLNERTFVLIKTHNYLRDKEILKVVLRSGVRYVGQLGPKARMEDLLEDLAKEGLTFHANELSRLYAPAGLDLGAESPEQIALSILGEMLAVKNNRLGGFLKDQSLPIHPR